MTNEQLSEPRYEIKRLYPGCPYELGTVLHVDHEGELYSKEFGYPKTVNRIMQADADGFPYLIRKLNWWEHRNPEDMPAYVKWKRTAGDYVFSRVLDPSCDCRIFGHEDHTTEHRFVFKGGYELATKEEYDQYINRLQQQNNKSDNNG